MKYIKSEKGYSLLLTLLIVIICTVLGMSILGLTMSGTARNETREEIVQSKDLATKGLDHINSQITKELNNAITSDGISASDYITKLDSIINKYNCTGGTSISRIAADGTGTNYDVCIYDVLDDPLSAVTLNNTQKFLRKLVTFKSTGISGDKTEILYSKYNIGATEYPEFLNYVVGTFKMKNKPALPGEGDLFLNGGVRVVGDFNVAADLITADRGPWLTHYYNNGNGNISHTVSHLPYSGFPEAAGFQQPTSKIVLQGNIYKLKKTTGFHYDQYINPNVDGNKSIQGGNAYFEKLDNISDAFLPDKSPRIINYSLDITPINFMEKYSALFLSPTSSNRVETLYSSGNYGNYKYLNNYSRNQETYLTYIKTERECKYVWDYRYNGKDYYKEVCENKRYYDDNEDFLLLGTNSFGKFGTTGSLRLHNSSTTFKNGAFIEGDLDITGTTTVKGTFYVKGNLSISNADFKSDAIFYVEKDVKIDNSVVSGIPNIADPSNPSKKRDGSMIVIAKGNVGLVNNSVDSDADKPSKIKGYLYSEQVMEIYGVGSNIQITGGISARKIILNAVRGNTRGRDLETGNFSTGRSRLEIIYDPEIIKTYSELDIDSEPWIESISPPEELDRSYTPN